MNEFDIVMEFISEDDEKFIKNVKFSSKNVLRKLKIL